MELKLGIMCRLAIPSGKHSSLGKEMPELSRFFGIRVSMYADESVRHHRPHLHAVYQNDRVALAVDRIEVLRGGLPRREQRLLEAWAELHQEELLAAWQQLQQRRPPAKIDPLR